LGTETDGSILNPAAFCGVVGMKPTVGTVPTRGVIPIAASQDVVGPIARSVADAALVLGVIADDLGPVRLDPNALLGRRIGVGRAVYCGYDEGVDTAFEDALSVLSSMGAAVVDPADIATAVDLRDTDHEITVMLCEFKDDLQAYIATRSGAPANLEQLIEFNTAHANVELAFFGQDIFEKAAATSGRADPSYKPAREACIRLARTEGIDATIARHQLDALVWPTGPTAWHIGLETGGNRVGFSGGSTPTAVAGYPAITVPSGTSDGLPVGIQFSGPAGSDALLLELAFAYEQASHLLVDAIPSSGG
jgi:amidase